VRWRLELFYRIAALYGRFDLGPSVPLHAVFEERSRPVTRPETQAVDPWLWPGARNYNERVTDPEKSTGAPSRWKPWRTKRAAVPASSGPFTLSGGMGWIAFALVVLSVAVHLPSLVIGFVCDDHWIVERNALIRDLSHVPEIVSKDYWNIEGSTARNLYRPTTVLSFALTQATAGARPLGHRLVNLILYVLVTLQVLALARRVVGSRDATSVLSVRAALAPPVVTAALFAIHPVHTEVLGEIVGRGDLLAAAFTLASVLVFLRARDSEAGLGRGDPRILFTLSIACFVLGALAKESALVAPVLVLLADRLLVRRKTAWVYHGFAAAALGAVLLVRVAVLSGVGVSDTTHFVDNPMVRAPLVEGRLTALKVIARYATLLVAPVRMSVDYSFNAIPVVVRLWDPAALLGGLLVLACGISLGRAWRTNRPVAFLIAWIGVTLTPVVNLLFPIGTIMAERLLFLPSVGFCAIAALGINRLESRLLAEAGSAVRRALAALLVPIAIVGYGLRTEVRYLDWRDDYTIAKSAIGVSPGSTKAHFNYAVACQERGDLEEAIKGYGKAIAIWPEYGDAHRNLADLYVVRGRLDEALQHYREALKPQPYHVGYLLGLGNALMIKGNDREAREVFRRAVALDRHSLEGHAYLGAAELRLGAPEAAVASYTEGLRIRPDDPALLVGLGKAILASGDAPGALNALERAVSLDPEGKSLDPEARDLLARLREGGTPGGHGTHRKRSSNSR
jgi:tetratricopeptide (TPR) repeat protein